MRDLRIDSCPVHINLHMGEYWRRDCEVSNLLLHNTEFESSTEHIFKTKVREAHVFKRVDDVVRFVEKKWEGQTRGSR